MPVESKADVGSINGDISFKAPDNIIIKPVATVVTENQGSYPVFGAGREVNGQFVVTSPINVNADGIVVTEQHTDLSTLNVFGASKVTIAEDTNIGTLNADTTVQTVNMAPVSSIFTLRTANPDLEISGVIDYSMHPAYNQKAFGEMKNRISLQLEPLLKEGNNFDATKMGFMVDELEMTMKRYQELEAKGLINDPESKPTIYYGKMWRLIERILKQYADANITTRSTDRKPVSGFGEMIIIPPAEIKNLQTSIYGDGLPKPEIPKETSKEESKKEYTTPVTEFQDDVVPGGLEEYDPGGLEQG